ncbi:MAG: hypothetical protein JXD18_08840 [Anaerolineae bacterium]|nr:hypothetical protein [Anaerolineae bacterium]
MVEEYVVEEEQPSASEQHPQDEKGEKDFDEKDERSWDEKWERDPVYSVGWAAIFIWAGFILLLQSLNIFTGLGPLGGWDLVFIGAGFIVFAQIAFRMLSPAHRRPVFGSFVLALVLIAVGLQDVLPEGSFWAVVLIIVGLGMLVRPLLRAR